MKAHVEAADLRKCVNTASMAVARVAVPILECLRIEAKDNTLRVTGTDMDVSVIAKCEAAVAVSGSCTINCADLKAICARARAKSLIHLELVDGHLALSFASAKLRLPTVSGGFPTAKKPESETEVEGGVEALAACIPHAENNGHRPFLDGVIIDGDTAIGTDGSRLFGFPVKSTAAAIVPRAGCVIAAKTGGRIFIGERTWRVEAEGIGAIGPLIDHDLVDWRRILVSGEPLLTFDADDAIAALEMSTVGRADWAVFASDGETLSVSGDRFKGTHIDSKCDLRAEGRPLSFVLNAKYALDSLKPFAGSVVSMRTNGNGIMFQPECGKSFSLVMIMRDHRTQLEAA